MPRINFVCFGASLMRTVAEDKKYINGFHVLCFVSLQSFSFLSEPVKKFYKNEWEGKLHSWAEIFM